jgi:DsbC/DsbD-like thiol-disulfide interchange protein
MNASKTVVTLLISLTLAAVSFAAPGDNNDLTRPRQKGFVTLDSVPPVSLAAGKPGKVEIRFRVNPGYHINSNKPNSELLIPTAIQFTPPEKITVGKISYPAGEEFALSFSPKEKLSVYTGDVLVSAPITAAKNAVPGAYTLKAELRYQACNDSSCFPPKTLPVEVVVNVKSATATK